MNGSPKKDIRQKYKSICSEFKKMDKHYKKIISELKSASFSKSSSIDETTKVMSRKIDNQQEEIIQLRSELEKISSGTSPLQQLIETRSQDLQDLIEKKNELNSMQALLKDNTEIYKQKHSELIGYLKSDTNLENINDHQKFLGELESIKEQVDEYVLLKEKLAKSVVDLDTENYDSTDINAQIVNDFENVVRKNSEFSPLKQLAESIRQEQNTLESVMFKTDYIPNDFPSQMDDDEYIDDDDDDHMELLQLKKDLNEITIQKSVLERELSHLKEEHKDLQETNSISQNELQILKETYHTLESAHQNLLTGSQTLEEEKAELFEQSQKVPLLQESNDALRRKLNNSEQEQKNLERTLRGQLSANEKNIIELEHKLQEYENPSDSETSFNIEDTITEFS